MTEKSTTSKQAFSADWFLQGALAKIGDSFDRLTGRRWMPSSSLATSELIETMKKLLDAEAKKVPGKGVVVPHNIKLKMQWDKFSTDEADTLSKLETELLAAAADHINDSLYYTFAPLRLEVKPDYFTEGVKLFVSFDKFDEDEREGEAHVTVPTVKSSADVEPVALPVSPQLPETFIARFEIKGSRRDRRLEFPVGRRVSVGRTGANDLVIDDISVSKIHASLIFDAQMSLAVADTGSTNGTFVNGQRIAYGKATRLADGDTVKFGEIDVVFEHVQQTPTPIPEIVRENAPGRDTVAIGGMTFTSRTTASPVPTEPVLEAKDEKTLELDLLKTVIDDQASEKKIGTEISE